MSEDYLPDQPYVWGHAPDHRVRWLPGAFGDRTTTADVTVFRVLDAEWDTDADPPERTILRAEIVEP
jgi:hypothetical protein